MRGLGLVGASVALSFAACAQSPNYGTGSGGTTGTAGGPGTAGTGAGAGTSGAAGGYTPPALTVAHPNPIISRHATTYASNGNGAAVVNGTYHDGGWNAGPLPAWVAIKLTAGPSQVLVTWDDGGTYNYQDPASNTVYGFPADYHFEVSANSTNGTDGVWTPAGTPVMGNKVRTRGQSFSFAGMSWIKMVITAAPANESTNGVQIGEIDVHDISATGSADDSWFFMGDSITAFAYDRAQVHQPSFAAAVNTASPAYLPAMINGGIGGEKTTDGLARLGDALMFNSDYHFFVLGYGTNDAANGQIPLAAFQSNLESMITMAQAMGHEPILPHIPFSGDGSHGMVPSYNAVIDTLTRSHHLQVGPDLYAHFMQNQDEFTCPPCNGRSATDNLHPNDVGLQMMNQLWADAVRSFYP